VVELSTHAGDYNPAHEHPRWSTLEEPQVPTTLIGVVVQIISACHTTQNTTALVALLNIQRSSMGLSMKHGAVH